MIATSRKSTFPPNISRQFEFTRIQAQVIALAYQALIPLISEPLQQPRGRIGRNQPTTTQRLQSKAGGA
jgi:hypothetical protein